MKPYRFHPQAEAELVEAALHYAAISAELGQRFYRNMNELIAAICSSPARFWAFMPPFQWHYRAPFPYAVIFIEKPDHILIVAVSPFKRRPGYWRERIK